MRAHCVVALVPKIISIHGVGGWEGCAARWRRCDRDGSHADLDALLRRRTGQASVHPPQAPTHALRSTGHPPPPAPPSRGRPPCPSQRRPRGLRARFPRPHTLRRCRSGHLALVSQNGLPRTSPNKAATCGRRARVASQHVLDTCSPGAQGKPRASCQLAGASHRGIFAHLVSH